MFVDDKGNGLANIVICILFIWSLSFISYAILSNVESELARYPGVAAMLVGLPGGVGALILALLACIRKPRKRGFLAVLLSILVIVVTFIWFYLPVIT